MDGRGFAFTPLLYIGHRVLREQTALEKTSGTYDA